MAQIEKKNISSNPDLFLFVLYIIFFVSVVFSFRAISSISIGLILITGMARHRIDNYSGNKTFLFFLISCCLLYLLQCISLLYTNNIAEGLKLIQRSSALILVPLAVFTSRKFLTAEKYWLLVFCFAVILSVASVYCLAYSSFKYAEGAPFSIFFYHDLVKPISQHAIQFSILIFCTLVVLFENSKKNELPSTPFLLRSVTIFLSIFLFLLSSKLVISLYIFYLLYFFFTRQLDKSKGFIFALFFIATVTILMFTPNPVSNRFRSIFTGNYMLFTQKEFGKGIYFNGVQFRLLQWRFTYEILNEQHTWIPGLTPGDAQSFLDRKYVETKMYTGVAGTGNHGFLGYHTHNQFLQTLLENGLPALIVFLFICYSLFKMAGESQKKELKWLTFLLILYCFTDAPLETQYGLIIFTFLPSFFSFGQESVKQKPSSLLFYNSPVPENRHLLRNTLLPKQPD